MCIRDSARAERKLGDAVEALSVPPSLINAVFNGDFVGGDGGFVEGVRELEVKLDHLSVSASKGAGRAVNDVAPELERLRVKAVDRAWAFLYGEFAALKKPRANVQLIQENSLSRVSRVNFLELTVRSRVASSPPRIHPTTRPKRGRPP